MNPLSSTYRLQLGAGVDFESARKLLPYLDRLGISHLYLSPIMTALPGSSHGYDVADINTVSVERGGEPLFRKLVSDARDRGMGVIVDFVPNHMATSHHNPYWFALLRGGASSPFADWFDVVWRKSGRRRRIELPVLGKTLREALNAGEIHVEPSSQGLVARYYEHRFPVSAHTLLELAQERAAHQGVPALPWEAPQATKLLDKLVSGEASNNQQRSWSQFNQMVFPEHRDEQTCSWISWLN
ncbi:MAG: hypothetical protein KDD44_14655, partial [Bdellovibrionales bacterium]|nr:hypothetical protein [Bdellovibrionales bacterium]